MVEEELKTEGAMAGGANSEYPFHYARRSQIRERIRRRIMVEVKKEGAMAGGANSRENEEHEASAWGRRIAETEASPRRRGAFRD